jgi:hypothetical protein
MPLITPTGLLPIQYLPIHTHVQFFFSTTCAYDLQTSYTSISDRGLVLGSSRLAFIQPTNLAANGSCKKRRGRVVTGGSMHARHHFLAKLRTQRRSTELKYAHSEERQLFGSDSSLSFITSV